MCFCYVILCIIYLYIYPYGVSILYTRINSFYTVTTGQKKEKKTKNKQKNNQLRTYHGHTIVSSETLVQDIIADG